ncbi:MAG TPA: hypothetical protein PLL53_20585 [Saprospiraceae bacterium]|nr:hypothetical protein [Saprospiraceae bacterium]
MKLRTCILLLMAASALFLHCCKDDSSTHTRVEIFGLQSFEWEGPGICAVRPGSVVLESLPLVTNDDIVSYNDSQALFEFREPSAQNIRNLSPRTPFALTLDGEVLFIGVVMQNIMSSTCFESITMENLTYGPRRAKLELGYPSGINPSLEDKRKDAALLAALRSQGKLR